MEIVLNDISAQAAFEARRLGPVEVRPGRGHPHPGYGPEYHVPEEWHPPEGFALRPETVAYGPDKGKQVFLLYRAEDGSDGQ